MSSQPLALGTAALIGVSILLVTQNDRGPVPTLLLVVAIAFALIGYRGRGR
jgi:hypothetical protein